MKSIRLFLAAAVSVIGCAGCCERLDSDNYTQYVNPKIGTGGHGHVFVGANVPFGAVQLGPTSIPQEWDWCSGYHESDSTVIGFSHTHLSGTGIGDLFDITVMPVTEDSLTYARGSRDDQSSGLWSYADRSREIARPGYYSVPLTRYGITAELTATARVGMHRYTFPEGADAGIVFDLENGGCWDRATDTFIEVADPQTGLSSDAESGIAIRGYRCSRGWANDQRIYFYAEFSAPFDAMKTISEDFRYAHLFFGSSRGGQVMMKVAVSPVSMEGAYRNMRTELPGWDFDAVAKAADRAWNEELGKISVTTSDRKSREIFYTAMYHAMIAPSVFCDCDGSYRGADGRIYEDPSHITYTTFSLWDTYRAAMPLYSIFQKERYADMINTMLDICREQGKLPVWHLHGCETDCMVGNPGIMPVADAVVKGIEGIDPDRAFEAIKQSAMRPDRGQDLRMEYGYIPCDKFSESVAYDLEYAIADAAAANVAEKLSREEDAGYFRNRSRSYSLLFDKRLGFIRGKDSKGEFRKEYSPFASTHRADDYCEGNGWQYTWLVPHDFNGLVSCFDGKELLIEKLDSLFTVSSVVEGAETSPDISGLIGQYAHGNEPSHHILYFYTMAGQPWKTADKVREVLGTLYTDRTDGLSGNEDVGQMSSWYIMSSMGFYQVEPGSERYWLGTPIFDEVEIKVGSGPDGEDKVFRITAKDNSDENRYIQRVFLNGKAHTDGYIRHQDIMAGGELVLEMGPEPAVWY